MTSNTLNKKDSFSGSSDPNPELMNSSSTESMLGGANYYTEETPDKMEVKEPDFNLGLLKNLLDTDPEQSPFVQPSPALGDYGYAQSVYELTWEKKQSRFLFYSPVTGGVRATSFQELHAKGIDLVGGLASECFWLDVVAPTAKEMAAFAKIFKIHPLTVEDILTEEVREKCELFKHYYFVAFRSFKESMDIYGDHTHFQPLNVYSIVFKTGIVTFHSDFHSLASNTLKKIDQLKSNLKLSPDWINYSILDEVTDNFGPLLRQVELEVDSVDELVLILKGNDQADMLRRIGYARKRVTAILRLLSTKPDVIKALTLRYEDRILKSGLKNGKDIKLYLSDIQDHLITMVQNLLHYEKVLSRAHSNYLAQISIEMTQVSNRINDVVAKLTAIASVLLPMNVISGMWGMNVTVPGQHQEGDTLAWFFGIVTCMIVIALGVFLFVRRYYR